MPIERVKAAIEAIRNGEMVIMMDDEDRENEGDLVYAATFSDAQKVNFLVSEAKGLVCVALDVETSKRLALDPMVKNNSSQHETAFTISVDDRECTTGISAHERDMTIKRLANPLSNKDDLVSPGHIFPLIAKDGGVLARTGHTEGSVDICRLAGVAPVAVICEIMKADGEMARRSDLLIYAQEHNMKIVYISDIIEYRLTHERLVEIVSKEEATFLDAESTMIKIKDHHGHLHTIYQFGEIDKNPLVKYHPIGKDLELLQNGKKLNILMQSIEMLKKEGGLLIFMEDNQNTSNQMKDFGIGAQILRILNVDEFRLITSHSRREYVGMSGFGIKISEEVVLGGE